CQQYHDLVTF
nr:immunoglobulin light chain junction region [Macaca mulatta]